MATQDSRRWQPRVKADERNYRYVGRDEFCSLLLGFKRLERADDSRSGVRGLRDMTTGVVYVIEREKLQLPQPHISTS